MSNFSKIQEERNQQKQANRQTRETMAKYFLDLSKLFLTAVALSALSPWLTNSKTQINWGIVVTGIIICIVFAVLAYRILKQK